MQKTLSGIVIVMTLCMLSDRASAQNCAPREKQLLGRANDLSARASGLGICATSREAAKLYRDMAAFHRQCVPGSAGAAQAAEFDSAARQADQTAAASCAN